MTAKPLTAPKPWWKESRAVKAGAWTLFAAVLGFVAWLFFFYPYVSTDDARVAAVLVRLAPQGSGGRVISIAVDAGSAVSKGQVLLELDHSQAQAELAQAQAKAALTLQDLGRAKRLEAQNAVPESTLDHSRAANQEAQAQLALAQIALDNTYLKSPMDGIVVEKTAEVGDMLEQGQTALTLADTTHAWIAANVEETHVGEVKIGQTAKISVDEGGDLTGKVSEITAASESQFSLIPMENPSGNFIKLVQRIPIKITLDDHPNHPLKVGESVEVHILVH
ncbi:MAG: HlyD family secretion protein [bacterium]